MSKAIRRSSSHRRVAQKKGKLGYKEGGPKAFIKALEKAK
jgi:protoporphyrinogen oxidase